jgi:hypothetical protein
MKPGSFLIPAVIIVFLVIFACNKNGSGGKPKLSLESIDKNPISLKDSMVAHFKFTNAGGKVSNGAFFSIRNRLNESPASDPSGGDTLVNPIPDIEDASKGEFRYSLPASGYLSQTSSAHQNDTIIMKFFVLTSSGVSSDTISSPKLVILNP